MSLRREPQQQRSQERLAQILRAAAEVFWELGYDNATTHDVAQRAGTAVGTVYRFFPDKLAIFHALEKRHRDRLSLIQARLLTPEFAQQPLRRIVTQIVQVFADYFLDPAPCVIYTQYFVAPELFIYFDESFDNWQIEQFAGLLRLRNAKLPEPKSLLLSQVFLRTYQALFLTALRGEQQQRPLLYKELEAVLFRYLEPHVGDDLRGGSPVQLQAEQMAQEHQLSDRQTLALTYALERGALTIQDFERLCPQVSRRSLQRDLKVLTRQGLLKAQGGTNQLTYDFVEKLATTSDK